ncbi:MAG: glycosyltransferase [Cyanobacteria bacterium SZAS LIN-3]|nr:glycosyltransferase [Cyanobacteria bacterium SZAS LIN-3]
MRRVLLTAHKFFPQHRAGTEVLTLKIAQELKARGSAVKIIAANPPDLDARRKFDADSPPPPEEHVSDYEYEGLPVHIVEEAIRLKDYEFSFEYYHPHMKRHFLGLLDDFQPDIVLVVHAQNLSASIVEACRERGVPVVFYATDFWFVCPVVQLTRPDGEVCRGPGPGALKCLTCYTPKLFAPAEEFNQALSKKYDFVAKTLSGLPGPVRGLAEGGLYGAYSASKTPAAALATVNRASVLRDFANKFDRILVPTKLMRDIFVENGIEERLIELVHYGIDTSKLVGHQSKSPSDILRIGYIGTFYEHKGVDLLINAFLALPDNERKRASLKLYGDTNQFPEYSNKLKQLVITAGQRGRDVTFEGTFPNDRLGQILSDIDVLVVPSRWYENTPLVMQSALATKTPLIVTDLGGMSELVKHGHNGLLFKLNDYRSLAAQLLALLKEPALLGKLTGNIKDERTVPEMVNDIESVFDKVLASRTTASVKGS